MFRLLGFDVRVRPGFVVFMLLIVVLYGDAFGIWLAVALSAFTIVHELGHAVAARHYGARAEISLDFLAGYTSYSAEQQLSPGRRAVISFAGPGTHIAVSLAVLVAMSVDPFDRGSIGDSPASMAVFWAGPVIGAFNLVPVLPLDGGHLVQTALERVIGARAQLFMVYASLAVTGAVAVWCLVDADRRFYLLFVGFLLMGQYQMLGAARRTSASQRPRRGGDPLSGRAAAAEAEHSAWRTGRHGMLLPGQELSPWYRAHQAVRGGRDDEARQILVTDLSTPSTPRWWPPEAAPTDRLRELVALLPRPFPTGNPVSEHVLADVLLRIGEPEAAGTYAAEIFARHRSAASALIVARAAAAVGDAPMSVAWLRAAAADPHVPRPGLAAAIDSAPELAAVRLDPDVRRLHAELTSG